MPLAEGARKLRLKKKGKRLQGWGGDEKYWL